MNPSYKKLAAKTVMAKKGKSFYFASRIFSPARMDKIALLYSICRYVDDCADELEGVQRQKALDQIKNVFQGGRDGSDLSRAVQEVCGYGVKKQNLLELLEGAEFDAEGGKITTTEDLQRYCYLVAGVVGLMMTPLLGVREREAENYAVSLGMGMQLTNICRDVLEDAVQGRCYLPLNEVNAQDLSLSDLAKGGETPQGLKGLVKKYLHQANEYYDGGYSGLAYIPFRPRLAILIAGEVYRAIGSKLAKKDFAVLSGRVYLNTLEKTLVSFWSLRFLFKPRFWIKNPNVRKIQIPGRS